MSVDMSWLILKWLIFLRARMSKLYDNVSSILDILYANETFGLDGGARQKLKACPKGKRLTLW